MGKLGLRIALHESYSRPKDRRSVFKMYCVTRFVLQTMVMYFVVFAYKHLRIAADTRDRLMCPCLMLQGPWI